MASGACFGVGEVEGTACEEAGVVAGEGAFALRSVKRNQKAAKENKDKYGLEFGSAGTTILFELLLYLLSGLLCGLH